MKNPFVELDSLNVFKKMTEKLKSIDSYSTISLSLATSQALFVTNKQKTFSSWMKKGNQYFKESISSSENLCLGERVYYSPDQVEYYRTIDKNDFPKEGRADFSHTKLILLSYRDYLKHYAVSLESPFPYDLRPENLISPMIRKTPNGFLLTFRLNQKALEAYGNYIVSSTEDCKFILAKQVIPPDFKNVLVSIELDESFLPLKAILEEEYQMKSLFVVKTKATCTHYFSYAVKEIPEIMTPIDYETINQPFPNDDKI